MTPASIVSLVLVISLLTLGLFFLAIHHYIIYVLKDFNSYMKTSQSYTSKVIPNNAFEMMFSGEHKWDDSNLFITRMIKKIKKWFNR